MITLAYLANQFPSAVEPYVVEEIESLRRQEFRVVACSARRPTEDLRESDLATKSICLQEFDFRLAWRALWLGLRSLGKLRFLLLRIVYRGGESLRQRLMALLHTALGFYLAASIERRGVQHIHVHHGYFSAWVAMVAARALGITYSVTLHGSDLLLQAGYLDTKLENCAFCLTVSEFNRGYILRHYPQIREEDVIVQHLGVKVPQLIEERKALENQAPPVLLAVGRLHAVKDHSFLLLACRELKLRGFAFRCRIAGEGPERSNLQRKIREWNLSAEVSLPGHIERSRLADEYAGASLVVLTSRSEGIPLTLMEAMAQGKPVLAPRITGIPELVIAGVTGFLYRPASLQDFVAQVAAILQCRHLDRIAAAAVEHVRTNFNQSTNLKRLAELFRQRVAPQEGSGEDANPVLQQIQLSLQRN